MRVFFFLSLNVQLVGISSSWAACKGLPDKDMYELLMWLSRHQKRSKPKPPKRIKQNTEIHRPKSFLIYSSISINAILLSSIKLEPSPSFTITISANLCMCTSSSRRRGLFVHNRLAYCLSARTTLFAVFCYCFEDGNKRNKLCGRDKIGALLLILRLFIRTDGSPGYFPPFAQRRLSSGVKQ